MLPIVWLPAAREDLMTILRYIANENPHAARRLKSQIEESLTPAADHPYLFRPSLRISGLREIVAHPSYIIFYRVGSDRIEVVNVVHARRKFP